MEIENLKLKEELDRKSNLISVMLKAWEIEQKKPSKTIEKPIEKSEESPYFENIKVFIIYKHNFIETLK